MISNIDRSYFVMSCIYRSMSPLPSCTHHTNDLLDELAKTKVPNLEFMGFIENDIAWFQFSMDYYIWTVVQVTHAYCYI